MGLTVPVEETGEFIQWRAEFLAASEEIKSNVHYAESAEMLRNLIKTKLLLFTDMQERPERFFEAHRLLLAPGTRGPGFGIRFTVQFNLFAGSILGLGSPDQVKLLDQFQDQGVLGCFCLTETHAGVNSGLVVNTTATWVPEKQQFLLHCPDENAEKNWISQGLTAKKAVVIADLIIEGKKYGPHGFLVDLNQHGVTTTDMGLKTTGNDLDNARIRFDNVWIPKNTLLRRFADIVDNKYVQTTSERMRLEVIGQRLLTGRLAIAQAGVVFASKVFHDTKEFASKRMVWSPPGAPDTYLIDLPQLKSLYKEAENVFDSLMHYTRTIEKELSDVLLHRKIPSADLVERIACAKIACIERSIFLCYKLKQEVGSYGLMAGTGFEHLDFLQCCKFAEGDSRILGQKIARDTMKVFQSKMSSSHGQEVDEACLKLATALSKASKNQRLQAWNDNWELVYGVSEAVIDHHISAAVGMTSKL